MRKYKRITSILIILALAFTAIFPVNWLGADDLSTVSANVWDRWEGAFNYGSFDELKITPKSVADVARENASNAGINVTTDPNAWTVAVYLCGTDLESKYGAASNDLNEMLDATENLPDDVNLNLIVLTGGAHEWHVKDENYPEWRGSVDEAPDGESTRIFQITKGKAVQLYQYSEYLDLGDTDTLKHFLKFVEEYAPAGHTMVTLWDHGGGPLAGCEVAMDTQGRMTRYITLPDLRDVLNDVMDYAKNESENPRASDYKYDIFSFDCCLMGNAEIAYELEPYADYMIGSEETEPGSGWNYRWLEVFGEGLGTDPAVKIGKKVVTMYSAPDENNEAAAKDKWRSSTAGFRDSTLALYDLSKMDIVKDKVDALGTALSAVYGLANKIYYYKITRAICELKSYDDGERGLVDSYLFARTICDQIDTFSGLDQVSASALADLRAAALDLIEVTGKSAPVTKVGGNVIGQIGGAGDDDGLVDNTGDDAILFRAVACDYAGGNGMSIFYPAHSTVLDENKEGVLDGNVYSTADKDNVLSFSRAVPNYVDYLYTILFPSEDAKKESAFNGTLESGIGVEDSENKTIAYIRASQDSSDSMDKLVDAKAYITTVGASHEGNSAILYGSLPAKYDSDDGGFYYVDTDQTRLGFKNTSTNDEFEFFTFEKSELASGDAAFEIPVYYYDAEADGEPKEKGTEISKEEVSYLGVVKNKDDGRFVVEYVKMNPLDGVGKKYPMSQYSGSLSFNPLYLRQALNDETTEPQIIYTAQTGQTIADPNGGDYVFEAQEIPADDDILVYSFKLYDIFGNIYESDHDPIMFTFNTDKISVDYIANKTYTGKEIKLTDDDIKFKYGELFKGENALSASDMKEMGIGFDITYKDNVNVGTATATVTIYDIVSQNPEHTKDLPDAYFQIVSSGDNPEPAVQAKDISKCEVSGIVAKTYNGKAQTQDVVIKDGTTTLKAGTDYTVSYKDNTDAGTATMTITGKGNYKGIVTKTFVIDKADNTMTVKVKKITARSNKKTSFKKSKVFKIKAANGKVTFKKDKGQKKKKYSKKITISKTGKVTVKKGLKKGKTYIIKVKVTAAGSKNYKGKTEIVDMKVKVK